MGYYQKTRNCGDGCNDNCCHESNGNGMSGTGLGLGIGGVAAGVPALIMSIIALVRENRAQDARRMAHDNGVEWPAVMAAMASCTSRAEDCSAKDSQIAKLEAERYSDRGILDLYKATVAANTAQDDKTGANFKSAFDAIVESRIEGARNDEKFKCLAVQVGEMRSTLGEVASEICLIKTREAVTAEQVVGLANATSQRFEAQNLMRESQGASLRKAIECLGSETYAAINCCCDKVNARIDCLSDKTDVRIDHVERDTRLWVKSQNYVQGDVFLRPSQICCKPMICGENDK